MHLSRRHLLTASAIAPLALVGCAGQAPNQTVAALAADVTTIAQGLQAEIPALTATGALSAAQLAQFTGYLTQLEAVATQISVAASAETAQPLVQQVEGIVNAAVAVVAKIPLMPPAVSAALQAVALLLPVIETGAGLAVTQLTLPPAAAPTPTAAAIVLKTPDQARAYLMSLAAQ